MDRSLRQRKGLDGRSGSCNRGDNFQEGGSLPPDWAVLRPTQRTQHHRMGTDTILMRHSADDVARGTGSGVAGRKVAIISPRDERVHRRDSPDLRYHIPPTPTPTIEACCGSGEPLLITRSDDGYFARRLARKAKCLTPFYRNFESHGNKHTGRERRARVPGMGLN
jgi:hypothetical protein